jgi:hypothetical protein
MRRILPLFLLAFLSVPALWGQAGVRWDLGGPIAGVSTTINQPSLNGQNANYLVTLSPVQLNWCAFPANSTQGTPCTNYSPTFTDLTLASACPSTQPIVLQQTNICTSQSDGFGNLGVNSPGGTFTYTLTYGSTTYGPFTVTLGGSGGGGGGSPNQAISFTSSTSVVLATSFTSANLVWECYDNANPANTIYPANVTVNPSTFSVQFTFAIPQSGYCVVNGSGGGSGGGGGGGVTSVSGDGIIFNNAASAGAVTLSLANTTTGSGGVVLKTSPIVSGLSSDTLTSTISTGTAPFTVASTTLVPNLNVNILNGITVSGTPSSGFVPTATSGTAATWQAQSVGGGNPTLDNCTPDQTGNSFYSVTSLTSYLFASWQFVFNTSTYINCTVYIPTAQTGATIVLDIATGDGTAGHQATFQTCDAVINSGTINPTSISGCASTQTFTTTSTVDNRVTLTFPVQSTLANGSWLVVKILTTPSGTAPTSNMFIYPHFVL